MPPEISHKDLHQGLQRLGLDDEWVSKLDPEVQYLASISVWPLMARYGFVGRNSTIHEKSDFLRGNL